MHMHFVICAILSTTIIVAICKKIFGVGTWAAVGRLAMLKKVTRLMCLGATSFTFLFINLAITAYAVPMIKQYAETETSWDSCFLNLVAIGAGLETTVETAVEVCGDMGDETRPRFVFPFVACPNTMRVSADIPFSPQSALMPYAWHTSLRLPSHCPLELSS